MFLLEPDPTPYDLRWRMFGINVRVHWMFWLISIILGWTWFNFGAGGLDGSGARGLGFVALWVGCVFVSILIHEMGHVVTGNIFGSYGHIVLFGFGGLAIGSSNLRSRWQRMVVYLAGPGAQFLLLGLIWFLVVHLELLGNGLERRFRFEFQRDPAVVAFTMLWFINLFWPILNLLPIWPLDGGQVSRELCEGAWRANGRRYSLIISMAVAIVLAVHIILSQNGQPGLIPKLNEWLPYTPTLLTAIFFGLFALQSYQMLQEESHRRRNWDDDRLPWER